MLLFYSSLSSCVLFRNPNISVYIVHILRVISYASETVFLNIYKAKVWILLEGSFDLLEGELCTLDSQLKQGWIINL